MASSPQNEPTMEEILASIRKIISEDSPPQDEAAETPAEPDPVAEPEPAPVVEPEPFFAEEPAPAEEEDLLELTPEMEQETSVAEDDIAFGDMDEPAQEPEPEPAPYLPPEPEPEPLHEALAEEEPALEEPVYEPEPEPSVPDMNMMTPPPAAETESLFSEKSRRALDDAMANLDRTIVDEETAQRNGNLEQTVGSIMLNAMREKVDPAVNRWLSENRAEMIAHMKPFVREWLDENFPALLEEAVRSEVARTIKLRSGSR